MNNAVPALRKPSTRAGTRAQPTATVLPPPSSYHESRPAIPADQVKWRKRSRTETADFENRESGPSLKRRNLGPVSGIVNPAPSLPGTKHPDSPSAGHNPEAFESPPWTQQFDDQRFDDAQFDDASYSLAIQDPISQLTFRLHPASSQSMPSLTLPIQPFRGKGGMQLHWLLFWKTRKTFRCQSDGACRTWLGQDMGHTNLSAVSRRER